MKRLIISIFALLMLVGCSKKEKTFTFRDVTVTVERTLIPPTPSATSVVPTPVVVSVATTTEENIAQSMERASVYSIDIWDIRLIRDNSLGLPLVPNEEFPVIVIIMERLRSSNTVQAQSLWEATVSGVNALTRSDGISGFYIFSVTRGMIFSGLRCDTAVLEITDWTKIRCGAWPEVTGMVTPLPPEMARLRGF